MMYSDVAEVRATSRHSILLWLENERNRRLLSDHLGGDYHVVTSDTAATAVDELPFDLCIVDEPTVDRHHDALRSRKRTADPTFLPYLLLSPRNRLGTLDRRIREIVDDTLRTPVVKHELDARVSNLLRTRRLSVEIANDKAHSDERFRSLFDAAPDPVAVVSPDGVITDGNEAFCDLVGLDRSEFGDLGLRSLDPLVRGPGLSDLLSIVESAGDTSPPSVIEWKGEAGEAVITHVNAATVDGPGTRSEWIVVFRDVTALKEGEARVRAQNERLKTFAGRVAHDLRNPLGIAQGYAAKARTTCDDGDFDTIENAHRRMEQLIDEILSLARLGQIVLEPGAVSLESVVRDAWANVATDEAELEIESNPTFAADRGRLLELLENIFRNSVDHAGDDVHVRVGTIHHEGIYVEDDGNGVPRADREFVFEAGYTTTDGGTGFGLSIVRQIVDGHGWDIGITDGTDGGLRLEITGVDFGDGGGIS